MPSLVILLPALIVALLTTSSVSAQTSGLRALASNPLLRGLALPRYAEISHEHFTEAVQHLLDLSAEKIAAIEQDEAIDFASLFDALGEIDLYFSRIWTPIANLNMVRNDKELGDEFRAAYEAAQLQIVELSLQLAQNPVIYGKLLVLAEDDSLDAVQQHLVKLRLDRAQRQGVGLQDEARERFNAITDELTTLGTRFANHILDATKEFQLILRDKSEIAGLPASVLARAAQNYQQKTGETASAEAGPWRITLAYPSYKGFMNYSERRDLREQLYRARLSIAAREPYDNTPLIQRILQLRQEKAQLLGFPHHAALVLSDKMAGNVDNVKQLLDELHEVGYANLLTEQEQLNAYAAAQGETEQLAPWDVAFWERKMKEEQFDLDTEALRQYFPLPRVLDGLFGLLNKMFGISMAENTTGVQVWHADVKFYDVHDADGTHIASFYFDPYSRPQDKAGGAWKGDCNPRQVRGDSVEMPVCHVVTNFAPPIGNDACFAHYARGGNAVS